MSGIQSAIASLRVSPLYAAKLKADSNRSPRDRMLPCVSPISRRNPPGSVTPRPRAKFHVKYRPNFPRISPLTFLRDLAMIGIE